MTASPRALILAAGLSTRLGTLSSERPKPLMPVCDVPLLRYAIALLAGHGITEIAINLHHLGQTIVDELGDGRAYGVQLHYSWEREILGTGGGIKQLAAYLTQDGREPAFIVNGKILIEVDLHEVLALHRRLDAVATMVVRPVPDAEKWGAIDTEGERVVGMIGRGRKVQADDRCMFTGVHVISPRLVAQLPDGVSDSIRQAYIPLMEAGAPIAAHRLTGYFHEHSTPRRYLDGNLNALQGRATIRHAPAPLVGVDDSARVSGTVRGACRIAARAIVGDGAAIEDSVIGHDAIVEPGAQLQRVVVWPGARASGVVADSIITPTQVIEATNQDA